MIIETGCNWRRLLRPAVHASEFSVPCSCSGSVRCSMFEFRVREWLVSNIEPRTRNPEPNVNTNREAITWKCELRSDGKLRLQLADQHPKFVADSSDGVWLTQINACAREEIHRIVASPG